jgi:ATP-dependent Lhr-like helicase
MANAGIGSEAATMIVDYLAVGRAALGAMPTQECLVVERFFDDTGGMQLVIHSPFGGRINRALGLGLRKKFCRTFNFELQAAATDDAVILSLGPHHSFPLDEVIRYLPSRTVRDTLEHAILDSPMFLSRWRWNLNRSLIVLRFRGGRRDGPHRHPRPRSGPPNHR